MQKKISAGAYGVVVPPFSQLECTGVISVSATSVTPIDTFYYTSSIELLQVPKQVHDYAVFNRSSTCHLPASVPTLSAATALMKPTSSHSDFFTDVDSVSLKFDTMSKLVESSLSNIPAPSPPPQTSSSSLPSVPEASILFSFATLKSRDVLRL